jgi:hypothetical protein
MAAQRDGVMTGPMAETRAVTTRRVGRPPLERRLDDGPPFVDLGSLERAQSFRRLLLRWKDLLADLRETLTHARVPKSIYDCRIKSRDEPLGGDLAKAHSGARVASTI